MAPGLTVNEAVLVLANWTPAAVAPESDTRYATGAATEMELGIENVTRRVLPTTVAIDLAVALAASPAPAVAGSRRSCTCEAAIVPEGNPEPVSEMVVVPGCPADGEALGASVTCACAACGNPSITSAAASTLVEKTECGFTVDAP